ncbi:MAG TPA: T9SS type A sorting domain-containing protein [Bacteroidia bacterium]|nr:T9SS type A sorting domain-containing protein [Bacteroidia bacterium]
MRAYLCFPLLIMLAGLCNGQGRNNTWLLGYNTGLNEMSRFVFDTTAYTYTQETRQMQFYGTEATISDEQGNFLMSSNGVWIANANNDTMMNGSGLNPGYFVNSFPNGLVVDYGNIILPFPGDTSKYILFHQTESTSGIPSNELFYSIIDITMDNGLGGVINKNIIAYSDSISWGISACRHANGRDWWVFTNRDSSDVIIKLLVTSYGVSSVAQQSLNYLPWAGGNSTQLSFSPNGAKLITTTYDNPSSKNSYLVISDFDRCTGSFSNTQTIQLTSGSYLWGLAFSPSGEFIYACSSGYLFQINSTTLTVDTVATYDGFISGFPPNCCATDFWSMYLAADGKIYITSGSSVQHHHVINYPDSAGVACDVQQHAIPLNVWSLRAVPNHPNYYLGAADGTVCDSLGLNPVNDPQVLDNTFKIKPNPNNGKFEILYILPQGESGILEVYNLEGKRVYRQTLPPWSTLQTPDLSHVENGVYQAVITSGGSRASRKVVICH